MVRKIKKSQEIAQEIVAPCRDKGDSLQRWLDGALEDIAHGGRNLREIQAEFSNPSQSHYFRHEERELHLRQTARYHAGFVHNTLSSHFGMPDGLTDRRLIILDLTPNETAYSVSLAAEIRRISQGKGPCVDGTELYTPPIWHLNEGVLYPTRVKVNATADANVNSLLFGTITPPDTRRATFKPLTLEQISPEGPVLVLFGCLPEMDKAFAVLTETTQKLQTLAAKLKKHGEKLTEKTLAKALEQAKAKAPYAKPMPPAEYSAAWHTLTDTIKQVLTTHNGLSPEQYDSGYAEWCEGLHNRAAVVGDFQTRSPNRDFGQNPILVPYSPYFRLADALLQRAGCGLAALMSRSDYLDAPAFEGMRRHLLHNYDCLWIDDYAGEPNLSAVERIHSAGLKLLGDFMVTPVKSIWVTPPAGTYQNTIHRIGEAAIDSASCLLIRLAKRREQPLALYRHYRPALTGRSEQASLTTGGAGRTFRAARPTEANHYSLFADEVSDAYLSWLKLTDICLEKPVNGLMEKRHGTLIDIDRAALEERMRRYHDRTLGWKEYAALNLGMTKELNRFDPRQAREAALAEGYSDKRIRRYAFKPFDARWCYYTPLRPIWNDPRVQLAEWCDAGNEFLVARATKMQEHEGAPLFFTRTIGDCDLMRGYAYFFPAFIARLNGSGHRPNLSRSVKEYLGGMGFKDVDTDLSLALLVWRHVLAITYSPAYLAENAVGLAHGYPHIPFPAYVGKDCLTTEEARRALEKSAELGEEVSFLLDSEDKSGKVSAALLNAQLPDVAELVDRSGRDTQVKTWAVRDWGGKNMRGAVVPMQGEISKRPYTGEELETIERTALTKGVHAGAAFAVLGRETYDICLNDGWRWRNVPYTVWNYTIGGYQVLWKWLSYREEKTLGRPLTREETDYFTQTVRRLTALRLLEPKLNQTYALIRDCSYPLEKCPKNRHF